MWTLGDLIIWGTLAIGIIPVAKLFWKSYGKRLVSAYFPGRRPEIMSSVPITSPSLPASPRTDAVADGRTEPQPVLPKPVTLDSARILREHKFTRDEARAFLKTLGYSLGNDTWARAQPTEDDEIVTPYAGRVTKREFYPDDPQLRYRDLEA